MIILSANGATMRIFVDAGIEHIEASLDDLSAREHSALDLAQTMAQFASQHRDCNFKMMAQETIDFLRRIMTLDGGLDPRDEQAIVEIENIFKSANRLSLRRKLRAGWAVVKDRSGRLLLRRKT